MSGFGSIALVVGANCSVLLKVVLFLVKGLPFWFERFMFCFKRFCFGSTVASVVPILLGFFQPVLLCFVLLGFWLNRFSVCSKRFRFCIMLFGFGSASSVFGSNLSVFVSSVTVFVSSVLVLVSSVSAGG